MITYIPGSKTGILHGFGKIHETLEDGIPIIRPILSAIGTPTYKLAKLCSKLLKSITTNEYTIKDSFPFIKKVEEFDPNLVMASSDVTFQQPSSDRNYWPLCHESL